MAEQIEQRKQVEISGKQQVPRPSRSQQQKTKSEQKCNRRSQRTLHDKKKERQKVKARLPQVNRQVICAKQVSAGQLAVLRALHQVGRV
jgi:hypothetical protein